MDFFLQKDVIALIIFGISIIIFIIDKLPMATTAILGCSAMVIFGVCDFATAFGEFASSTIIMLISVFILSAGISKTGATDAIGKFIIKTAKGDERALLAISYLLAALFSTFLTNVTVLAMFIPLIFGVGENEKRNINPKNLILPITIASNMGGITTLVGSSQQMTAQGLIEEYGYVGFRVFDFTPIGVILIFAGLFFCLFIGYPLGKKIWGDDKTATADFSETTQLVLEKKKLVTISIIFVFTMLLYIFQGIPFTDIEIKPVVTAVMSALAVIITGCISQKDAFKAVNWDIVGRLAGCLGLAKALDAAGSIELISKGLKSVGFSSLNPFLIFAIICLIAQISSWFISNSTAISVTLLVVIAIAPELNLNVRAIGMGIAMSASMGCSCPLSGSTYGIAMSAGYKFRDFFKYGFTFDVICYIIIITIVPLLFGGIICK